jgi:hypothetical protein
VVLLYLPIVLIGAWTVKNLISAAVLLYLAFVLILGWIVTGRR